MRANTATTAEKEGAEREGSYSNPCAKQGSVAPEDNCKRRMGFPVHPGNPFPICDILIQNTDRVHESHEMQKQKIMRWEAPYWVRTNRNAGWTKSKRKLYSQPFSSWWAPLQSQDSWWEHGGRGGASEYLCRSTEEGVELQILTQPKHRHKYTSDHRQTWGLIANPQLQNKVVNLKQVVKSPLGKHTRKKLGASMTHTVTLQTCGDCYSQLVWVTYYSILPWLGFTEPESKLTCHLAEENIPLLPPQKKQKQTNKQTTKKQKQNPKKTREVTFKII